MIDNINFNSSYLDVPPKPITSDFVELGYLVMLFMIGGPLNLAAYTQNFERTTTTRLDILKRHLNYSDLLVLFIYVPSRVCWLVTYDWRGGDFLCKMIKFLHTFVFQISSNVIVVIGIDRLLSVTSHTNLSSKGGLKRTRKMLAFAWIIAILLSSPQFTFWKNYMAFQKYHWSQCLTIWQIRENELFLHLQENITFSVGDFKLEKEYRELKNSESIYLILHVLCIFWIPAAIICMCYIIVSSWVYFNSKPSSTPFQDPEGNKTQTTYPQSGGTNSTDIQQPFINLPLKGKTSTTIESGKQTLITTYSLSSTANKSLKKEVKRPLRKGKYCLTESLSDSQLFSKNPDVGKTIFNSTTYYAKITRSKAIKVSFLLITAYFICWLPYNVMSIVRYLFPNIFEETSKKLHFLHGFIVFNSVINPFIYGLFNIGPMGHIKSSRKNKNLQFNI
ncbi:Gonadotropin-releasing hormone receptor [Strongyloides ratti]|uniref:Gonadotropin-releasing hormone receptor n=1 Tax=Strongyloides ratti TaxID=34506 RepID=A0A090MZ23_STRRB|nr:Gonadotropin-releasing hormone receptor [Strongyloides ratti]CEF68184.1 Gonadotropin-releasing hormone receptor [Strongyloides ratti]